MVLKDYILLPAFAALPSKTNIFVPSLLKANPLGSPPIEVKVVSAAVIDPISYGVLKDHLSIPSPPVPKIKITVPSELNFTSCGLASTVLDKSLTFLKLLK